MSKFIVVECPEGMHSLEATRRALLDLGFLESEVKLDEKNPKELRGYRGDGRAIFCPLWVSMEGLNRLGVQMQTQKSKNGEHIKGYGGSSNDMGFFFGEDGKLKRQFSQYDIGVDAFGTNWMQTLKERHDMHVPSVFCEKHGFKKLLERRTSTSKGVEINLVLRKGF